jgi:hypothetical protein
VAALALYGNDRDAMKGFLDTTGSLNVRYGRSE